MASFPTGEAQRSDGSLAKVSSMADYELRRVSVDATLADAHAVRRAVFIDEQDVPESVEMDDRDEAAVHVVAYDGERAVGTARFRVVDAHIGKAERVAVRSEYRGEGLGTQLMDAVESEAAERNCSSVVLHAQTTVEEFYRKLGYETIGDEFEQAGIPHVEMGRELDG